MIDIGAFFYEKLANICVATFIHRRPSLFVDGIDIGAVFDEQFGCF